MWERACSRRWENIASASLRWFIAGMADVAPSPAPGETNPEGNPRENAAVWPEILLVAVVLLAGLWLRTHEFATRPMHADEANQAVKLGQMLEGRTYVFDPHDHHGPTLYYLGVVAAGLRGESTLAALTETTVRLVPALAGVVAVGLLWLLVRPLGRWLAFSAALLLAVSPAAVYYSRYFIQETLLVTFTLGALVGGQRWMRSGGWKWSAVTGGCFGLMLATKSSAFLFAAAAWLALVWSRPAWREGKQFWRDAGVAGGVALFVAALFYSSFGANPAGLRDALVSPGAMLARISGGASGHEKPWWYYASLFVFQRNGGYVWDQTLFLLTAVAGGVMAWRGRGLPRFVAVYTAIVALVMSATPYKTPWLVVSLVPGLCVLAAFGLARLRWLAALPLLAVIVLELGWQTRQAAFLRPADPRNPFAYVHTSPDMLKVPALASAAQAGPVKVISEEYWPLPWYLRSRRETGYWTEPPADCDGALVFASANQAEAVRARLRGNYHESFLGLRPGFVLVVFARKTD
jgi:uncharacterized protein (TIGR03663 family)